MHMRLCVHSLALKVPAWWPGSSSLLLFLTLRGGETWQAGMQVTQGQLGGLGENKLANTGLKPCIQLWGQKEVSSSQR